jgi:hypothetical protein
MLAIVIGSTICEDQQGSRIIFIVVLQHLDEFRHVPQR